MKKQYLAIAVVLSLGMMSCGGGESHEGETTEEHAAETTEVVEETADTEEVEEIEEVAASTDYAAGEEVYNSTCKACHQENGEGIVGAFPPLANSDYLLEDKNRAIKQVLEGSSGEIVVNGETYNGTMTPQNLEDQQVVDVVNYVLNSWGNEGGEVTLEDVQSQKGGE